jgi:hypothetical protein
MSTTREPACAHPDRVTTSCTNRGASGESAGARSSTPTRNARYASLAILATAAGGLGGAASHAEATIVTGNNGGLGWTIDSFTGNAGGNQSESNFASNGSNGGSKPLTVLKLLSRKYPAARTMYFSGVGGGQARFGPVASGAAIGASLGGFWGGAFAFIGSSVVGGNWKKAAVGILGSASQNFTSVTAYVPFRFVESSITKYGWFQVQLTASGTNRANLDFRLLAWAYNDTGGSINAGQVAPSGVPGGAGLAALAFGAAGLRGRRRSRN